ncbi:hypothetical protein D3C75_323670 [compost metagenome]
MQALLGGQLNVDAHAVSEHAQPGQQGVVCAGNGFYMNITAELILIAQQLKRGNQLLGRIVGAAHNTGAEEQPLYIITAVELHGNIGDLLRSKGSPPDRVRLTVNAIGAVINAAVGHQHLKQRNAASIRCKAVADSKADRISEASGLAGALGAA